MPHNKIFFSFLSLPFGLSLPLSFNANRGNSLRRVKNGNKWRAKEINFDQKPTTNIALNRLSANLTNTELSPALIAQANWTFVERLLKVFGIFLKYN